MTDRKASGRPRSGLNTIVAAVAEANGCAFVADNEEDFLDFDAINAFKSAR